jgi:membrane-associated phospholipid phosphatase
MTRTSRLGIALCLLSTATAPPALAQDSSIDTSAHAQHLFTRNDAILAGGFAALTVAMFPLDRSIAHELQDSAAQANRVLRNATRNIQYFADPGSMVIGVSMYALGRVGHFRNVADVGLHGTEAVMGSGIVTGVLKDLVGRSRPYVSADTNPHDFSFGRGFRGGKYQSFPSGHTTAAFAAASAVTSEARRLWPHHSWIIGPIMYGGATLVGASRIYNNAHWASDVALGAAIGTFTGLKVVRYSHQHPDNPVDRLLLGLQATPSRVRGVWSVSF